MNTRYLKHCTFANRLLILGFGSVGQAVLPLLFRHIDIRPEQITIISAQASGQVIAAEYGVDFREFILTPDNYRALLDPLIHEHDFLLNVSVDVSSLDLIHFCHEKNALYLDTSTEIWPHEANHHALSEKRSNYALRENVLASNQGGATAVITHGANPGLVSHFAKQALLDIARDCALDHPALVEADWARLAEALTIRTIQVAEYDSQISSAPKQKGEFVNTWSVDGLIIEAMQPAEAGWGTHERHWPADAKKHSRGSCCALYMDKASASVKVHTWTPLAGAFEGFMITHAESISLAEFLSVSVNGKLRYRPTVHYAYSPCPDAIRSIQELVQRDWVEQPGKRLLVDTIVHGMDELGVLLLGHPKGAYWFGSQLSIEEARKLAPHNNATTLQVAASVLGGMIWAIENPDRGIVEPEAMDYERVLTIARPYLGTLAGYYSDWTPLQNSDPSADDSDPWQFRNIRIDGE